MYLDDLKFQVRESNNVQMILYDTFSINIPAENHKESKIQLTAPRESRKLHTLVTSTQDKASSSSDCINDYTSAEQQDKFFSFLINDNHLISDKIIHIMPGHDDTKENLDPGRSKTISRNGKLNNVNLTNNVDDTAFVRNVRSENDDDVRLSSNNTNLNTLNRTICNTNIDNITDNIELASNDRSQDVWISLEDTQQYKQASAHNTMPSYTKEKISNVRLFHEDTNKMVHDLGCFVNTNKNVEKLSQDNISVFANQYNVDKEIDSDNRNWHTIDYSKLWNSCKTLDIANTIMLKAQNNRRAASVSNITFNERNILNKQIDACDSGKFIHCTKFCDDNVNNTSNSENVFNCNNIKHCLKVSIDLCKIRNLIDSKPELFTKHKRNGDQRRKCTMNRSHSQTDLVQQQVRL